jgi:hypothetical protein
VHELRSTRKIIALAGLLFSLLLSGCRLSPAHTAAHSYSTVINVKLSDWQPATNTAGQKGFVVDRTVPELTDEAVDHDGVAVYYMFEGSDRYEPLPLVFNSVIYHAYHSKGKLSLRMFSAIGQNLGERPPPEVTDLKAKIVIF